MEDSHFWTITLERDGKFPLTYRYVTEWSFEGGFVFFQVNEPGCGDRAVGVNLKHFLSYEVEAMELPTIH